MNTRNQRIPGYILAFALRSYHEKRATGFYQSPTNPDLCPHTCDIPPKPIRTPKPTVRQRYTPKPNPSKRYLVDVEFRFDAPDDHSDILMPYRRPGRYEGGNFPKNVIGLREGGRRHPPAAGGLRSAAWWQRPWKLAPTPRPAPPAEGDTGGRPTPAEERQSKWG